MLPLQFSTLLSFLITISTVDLHLTSPNINKISTCPIACYFLTYLCYQFFLMYAPSYTIFIKTFYCCYHEIYPLIYSQIEVVLIIFILVGYIFWGHSLLIYHTVMPIGRINSHEIFTEISHITANILLKRTNMLLFTPSATTDIN